MLLPISAIVATRNRCLPLERMFSSLAQQSAQPVELIVIDGSTNDDTYHLCQRGVAGLKTTINYQRAKEIGAATQRNQAMDYITQDFIWFLDDDVLFEDHCVERLWNALQRLPLAGGVNSMITNQRYTSPGFISRSLYRYLHGKYEASYAGKCIGPALNILPEDDPSLPEIVLVEWLVTCCTLYRREALPDPPFANFFTGYSLLEDLALSLMVGKHWLLANARTARIYHDSQPGDHKDDVAEFSRMEIVNRHYVMKYILKRQNVNDYLKLGVWELFSILTVLATPSVWFRVPKIILGKYRGVGEILVESRKLLGKGL